METSILVTIRTMLVGDSTDTSFDTELITFINNSFFNLYQIGVSDDSFVVTGTTETWNDFLQGKLNFETVKTYVYLKVKLMFDPPSVGGVLDAIKASIAELEWRLNLEAEQRRE